MIRGTGPGPTLFAVNMLVNTPAGGTCNYEQYQTWLQVDSFAPLVKRVAGKDGVVAEVEAVSKIQIQT